MESNENLHAKNERLTKWIGELEDKNDDLEDLNGILASKERQSNDELRQARKELTMVLLHYFYFYVFSNHHAPNVFSVS
jgi:hypothetical protein